MSSTEHGYGTEHREHRKAVLRSAFSNPCPHTDYREAATRLAHSWASSIGTVALEPEVHVVDYVLTQLADPASPYGDLLDYITRQRGRRP